jgi:hypothetical protein
MKNIITFLTTILFSANTIFAQVAINGDNSTPDPSAMLEVKSSTRGLLPPRMTTSQINNILNPANGLEVFSTTDSKLYIYVASSGKWKELAYGTGTIDPTLCGNSLVKNHVAGPVAPVSTTVTYGTVGNIAGEPAKCWITRNLGASQQPTSWNDNSELSAGWYWQFNRKQGYKHDGTTITPIWNTNTDWPDLDWQAGNDPCSIELGSAWRIPTNTEWLNVDLGNGWTSCFSAYISPLKLHAAGQLDNLGFLGLRGSYGYYWSSTHNADYSTAAYYLVMSNQNCNTNTNFMFFGYSIRCLRE